MTLTGKAWMILASGIIAYDLACPVGQTLSAGCQHAHRQRPWLTRTVVAYLAAHLLGWLPRRVDVLTQLANSSPTRRRIGRNIHV